MLCKYPWLHNVSVLLSWHMYLFRQLSWSESWFLRLMKPGARKRWRNTFIAFKHHFEWWVCANYITPRTHAPNRRRWFWLLTPQTDVSDTIFCPYTRHDKISATHGAYCRIRWMIKTTFVATISPPTSQNLSRPWCRTFLKSLWPQKGWCTRTHISVLCTQKRSKWAWSLMWINKSCRQVSTRHGAVIAINPFVRWFRASRSATLCHLSVIPVHSCRQVSTRLGAVIALIPLNDGFVHPGLQHCAICPWFPFIVVGKSRHDLEQ